jgi:hypothetical protein
MIKTHKRTGQKLLVKSSNDLVSTLFILDGNNEKIPNGRNSMGKPSFKIAVCLNQNLI